MILGIIIWLVGFVVAFSMGITHYWYIPINKKKKNAEKNIALLSLASWFAVIIISYFILKEISE